MPRQNVAHARIFGSDFFCEAPPPIHVHELRPLEYSTVLAPSPQREAAWKRRLIMLKMCNGWTWSATLASLLGMLGCGAEGGAGPVQISTDPSATTNNEDVGTATEAFGESTCGSAPPDATLSDLNSSLSPNAGYDHSGCRNSYVAQVNSSLATSRAFAVYRGAVVGPCNAMWAAMSLWKLVNGTFTKVGDGGLVYGAAAPDGSCLPPSSELQIPSDGTYKVIGQAGWATSFQQVAVGTWAASTYDMSVHDDRGSISDGNWAGSGLIVGECFANRTLAGVSRMTSGTNGVRNILCTSDTFVSASNLTLDFTNTNDWRAGDIDWAIGFIKGECPAGSAMTALAQTSLGVVNKARCAPAPFATRNFDCKTYDFTSGDKRASLNGADWSFGDFKGECDSNHPVVGISKDASGKPKSIRCCRLGS